MISDDLSSLFDKAKGGVVFRQGRVTAWDAATGENTIVVAGAAIANVPSLTSEAATLQPDDVVMLLASGTTWLVLGKVTTPGDPDTVPTWSSDLEALAPLQDVAQNTSGTVITGITQQSAAEGARVVINDPAYPGQVLLYTGGEDEAEPSRIYSFTNGTDPRLRLLGPKTTAMGESAFPATLDLEVQTVTGTRRATLDADRVLLTGTLSRAEGETVELESFSGASITLDYNPDDSAGAADVIATHFRHNGNRVMTEGTNPQPVRSFSATDITSISNTSFSAGTPVVGVAFTAPASGKVYVTVSAHMASAGTANSYIYCAPEIRTGSTVGSGTVFYAANTDDGVSIGQAGTTITRINAGNEVLIDGLTPGSPYNVRLMHLVTSGTNAAIFYRAVLVKPVL